MGLLRLKQIWARTRSDPKPDAPFADRQIRRDGFDFESRFFVDGTVVVRCEVLMQTEVFRPGEGEVDLADAERSLVAKILADNAQHKSGGDESTSPRCS